MKRDATYLNRGSRRYLEDNRVHPATGNDEIMTICLVNVDVGAILNLATHLSHCGARFIVTGSPNWDLQIGGDMWMMR